MFGYVKTEHLFFVSQQLIFRPFRYVRNFMKRLLKGILRLKGIKKRQLSVKPVFLYAAGYLHGVLQGWSLSRRMTFAAAAAALATTALGARGCIPALSEVEALVRTGLERR